MVMEDMIVLGITSINVILTALLLVLFTKSYKTVKSRLTLGLVFFAAAFLLENLMNLYFYNAILIAGVLGTTTYHLVVAVIEMLALIAILYVNWK